MKKLLTLIAALFLSVSAFAMDAGLFEKMIPQIYKTETIIVKVDDKTHHHPTKYLWDIQISKKGKGELILFVAGYKFNFADNEPGNHLKNVTISPDKKVATIEINEIKPPEPTPYDTDLLLEEPYSF